MSGDYTKNTIGSSLPSNHQHLVVYELVYELDSLFMKVDL